MSCPAILLSTFCLTGAIPGSTNSAPVPERAASSATETPAPAGQAVYLDVDLRELHRSLIHVRQQVPVHSGSMTLVYPKWLPGEHAPKNQVGRIAGLHFRAKGVELSWNRDEVDLHAFHLEVPSGCQEIEVLFDVVTSTSTGIFNVQWEKYLLYPAQVHTDRLEFTTQVTLPANWEFATPLEVDRQEGAQVRFRPTNLTMLVDSPMILGRHVKRVVLGNPEGRLHRINLVAESEASLKLDPTAEARLKALVEAAGALFGARHYAHYDFLVAVGGEERPGGLEHHQCSEDEVLEGSFDEPNRPSVPYFSASRLLSHEFAHSWNGKHRRPQGMATPDYQEPMRCGLLWVYEGLTDYYGYLLARRSGLLTTGDLRDALAHAAALTGMEEGRKWRSLEDTTVDPVIGLSTEAPWVAMRRDFDYYPEGMLLWLEVDALIRQKSDGFRSLDDFTRTFFGGRSGEATVSPYSFDDLIAVLSSIQAFDWRTFFRERTQAPNAPTPESSLAQCGWRLAWAEEPSTAELSEQVLFSRFKGVDTQFGFGARIALDGTIQDLRRASPADAGLLAPHMKILGVNGKVWTPEALKSALKSKIPLELVVSLGNEVRTIHVEYKGGMKHPRLERIAGVPDLLTPILEPKGKP